MKRKREKQGSVVIDLMPSAMLFPSTTMQEIRLSSEAPLFEGALALAQEGIEELLRRHQAEEAMERLEKQRELREKQFTLICHDLRSPLSIAKMCADLIQHQPEKVAVLSPLSAHISTAIDRANGMLKDFLDASRIQGGSRMPIRPVACDMHQLVSDVLAEFSVVHKGRFRYEGQGPVKGVWDPEVLARALENLLTNALKYGDPSAEVSVAITTSQSQARLSVHNHGNPIAAKDIPLLFHWHMRTESAQTSERTGWGLGLALVKGAAEAHDGSVEVQSCRKKGTTFALLIPRERCHPAKNP